MEYENVYETVLKEIFIEDVFRIVWDYVLKPSNKIAKEISGFRKGYIIYGCNYTFCMTKPITIDGQTVTRHFRLPRLPSNTIAIEWFLRRGGERKGKYVIDIV